MKDTPAGRVSMIFAACRHFLGKFPRELLRAARRTLLRGNEFRGGMMLAIPGAHPGAVTAAWAQAGGATVHRIVDLPAGTPLDPGRVTARQKQGHVLYGLVEGARLLAWGWVSGAGCGVGILHRIVMEVPARSIYIWDCFTVPEERNRGHYRALLHGILHDHPDIRVAYVAVDWNNAPSIKALERAGFRCLFRYYGLKLFHRPIIGIARTERGLCLAGTAFDDIEELTRRMNLMA